jgi:hypothetical protein
MVKRYADLSADHLAGYASKIPGRLPGTLEGVGYETAASGENPPEGEDVND